MTPIAAALKHMLAAGMAPEAIVAAVSEMELALGAIDAPVRPMRQAPVRQEQTGPYTGHVWLAMKMAVIARDSGRCAYCDDHDDYELTADHVIPLSRGGAHDERNLVCCCVPCNNSKRNTLLADWPGRSTTRRHKPFDHITGLAVTDA